MVNGAETDPVALVVRVLTPLEVETLDHPGTAGVKVLEASSRSF